MPITIKKPSATEITSLYNILLEGNNAVANPIPAARMEEILQPLDTIMATSIEKLYDEELISAQQNIVNLKYQFFASILNDFYPVCVKHGSKIFKILYNKFEPLQFRPNLPLAVDKYRGSLLARIFSKSYRHRGFSSIQEIELIRTVILYGDDIVYALIIFNDVEGRNINGLAREYIQERLNVFFPHINYHSIIREMNKAGLRNGYFSARLLQRHGVSPGFMEKFPLSIPTLFADNRLFSLMAFINTNHALTDEINVPYYFVKFQTSKEFDLRKIKFDHKMASEMRKMLNKSNWFKFIFDNIYSGINSNNHPVNFLYGVNIRAFIYLLTVDIVSMFILNIMNEQELQNLKMFLILNSYKVSRVRVLLNEGYLYMSPPDKAAQFHEKFNHHYTKLIEYTLSLYLLLTPYYCFAKFGIQMIGDNIYENEWLNSLPKANAIADFIPNVLPTDNMYLNSCLIFACYLTSYSIASVITILSTTRNADLSNIAIEPENMVLSPTFHGDMLNDMRRNQHRTLTVCFNKLAEERKLAKEENYDKYRLTSATDQDPSKPNGIIDKIMDYSIGEPLPTLRYKNNRS